MPGNTLRVHVFAKGGGGEAKAHFAILNPSDSIVDWVLRTVPTMGAGWCPPGMLGIGIGGNPEKAMELAKAALMEPLDMHDLQQRGPRGRIEELRIELYEKVNALGTIPVSWHIGRWPSAAIREFIGICSIASLAAGDCSISYARARPLIKSTGW